MLKNLLFAAMVVIVLPLQGFGFSNIDSSDLGINDSVACYNEFQPALSCLETTIQEGSWVDYSTASVYEFHSYGLVDVISENIDGSFSYDSYHWTVGTCEGFSAVILSQNGNSFCIPVEAISSGVISTNLEAGNTTLSYLPEGDVIAKEALLINSWVFGDVENKTDAYLSYDFHKDGTYTRSLGNLQASLSEQGIWEISKDGRFIIFYASENENAESVYKSYVVEVIEFSQEGLIIETPMNDMDVVGFFGTDTNFDLTRSHIVR